VATNHGAVKHSSVEPHLESQRSNTAVSNQPHGTDSYDEDLRGRIRSLETQVDYFRMQSKYHYKAISKLYETLTEPEMSPLSTKEISAVLILRLCELHRWDNTVAMAQQEMNCDLVAGQTRYAQLYEAMRNRMYAEAESILRSAPDATDKTFALDLVRFCSHLDNLSEHVQFGTQLGILALKSKSNVNSESVIKELWGRVHAIAKSEIGLNAKSNSSTVFTKDIQNLIDSGAAYIFRYCWDKTAVMTQDLLRSIFAGIYLKNQVQDALTILEDLKLAATHEVYSQNVLQESHAESEHVPSMSRRVDSAMSLTSSCPGDQHCPKPNEKPAKRSGTEVKGRRKGARTVAKVNGSCAENGGGLPPISQFQLPPGLPDLPAAAVPSRERENAVPILTESVRIALPNMVRLAAVNCFEGYV
jgi:hypothetical protein